MQNASIQYGATRSTGIVSPKHLKSSEQKLNKKAKQNTKKPWH